MSDWQKYTYAAVITIDVPGQKSMQAKVTLLPPDEIPTFEADGQQVVLKPLRDCTLADLRGYADELEAELWLRHEQDRLADFVAEHEADVEIRVKIDDHPEPDDMDDWWEGAALVLFPVEEVQEAEETEEVNVEERAESESEAIEGPPLVQAVVDETASPAENGAAAAPPAEPSEMIEVETKPQPPPAEPAAVPAAPEESDLAPRIIVAEPELVIPEREGEEFVRPVHVIKKRDTENRLAGYRMPLEDPTPFAVDVLIDEHSFRDAQAHALSSMSREVAGMLVGPPPEKQPNGRYVVHITDTIEAKHTRMHGASVTYTPESWRYVNDVLLERYPNEECVIVGWYHTHPGFGIFLSNMDLFIHHNFFIQKWHVALVLDPIGQRSGFFTWNRAQSEVMAYHFPWPYWAHSSW